MLTSSQLRHYRDHGYLIIERAVPDGLLEPLRTAAGRLTDRTRRGEWPYKRDAGDGDIWGVSHLLHPDVGEPIFAEYIASPVVLDVVADLLRVSAEAQTTPLQLELVNMLVNPAKHDYEIGWHRDLVRADLPPDEEVAELRKLQLGVQWNTALYDEACLHIVPASHLRPKTETERDVVFNHPTDSMPDQLTVELKAGQGVYYNANLLHRGVYRKDQRRETLHCCMGTVEGAKLRASLYGWLAWMTRPDVRQTLPERLHPLYDNFVKMARLSKEQSA
ncbi:MAG: phytanoyl-CoA dioxygenase family protein [Candidatus Latescibacteria bacterium]|nr:phytanoyl-CoA dioxygenase family protein [Candidatus Latescibacterota bacterium]